ncbi:glutathione S-transferase family protein [Hydrogenophaga sp. 5NK40-0174]|uniref:glutathione S-transferase family protein n=1 Tax=Hydrogenophaga sp. 5NK40-0174 TaxID=3127649 RepID=UPI003105A244
MPALTLYTNPMSRGTIAHWMMEEVAEPYETVWLDLATTAKTPDYLAINPMGKVPALVCDGQVVTEAAAICAFMGDRFPEKGLAPAFDAPGRAAYVRWLFFAAGPLEQAITAKAMGWEVPPGREGTVGFGTHQRTIDALQTALEPGPFVCGEQFTAADVYVGSAVLWGLQFGTIEKRPVFEAYAQRLSARPAYQRYAAICADRRAAG